MDIVKAHPRVHGKSGTLSVVNRLTKKCAHFIPLARPYTAMSVLLKPFLIKLFVFMGCLDPSSVTGFQFTQAIFGMSYFTCPGFSYI